MKEFYKEKVEDVLKECNSSVEGLDDNVANELLKKNGPNKLKETKKRGFLLKLLDQFKNLMIIILIISAILSAIVSHRTGEPFTDTIIIFVVVILNAVLGVMQESKAEKAIEALKEMSLPYIKVKRNNTILSIRNEDLVVGDIVILEAGDYIPADLRIIENHSLRIEEAALTGESVAVDKQVQEIVTDKDISLADRVNMAYSGSSVVYGRGEGVVVATGMNTELGKIAEAISSQKSEITPLQKKINELSKVLSIIVVIIAVAMFIVGYLQGHQILDVFMLAISLAVAAIPEGLSAVITITLALGVQKMAKEKAIVRKLSAVEALGATEVICSDKTGTLTQNKMTLRKIYLNGEMIDVSEDENIEKIMNDSTIKSDLTKLADIFVLCNDTEFGEENGLKVLLGDPTETALVDFGAKISFHKEEMDLKYKRIDELPFDSKRKMMTTVNMMEDKKAYVFTKGAVESILEISDRILEHGKVRKITQKDKKEILENNLNMAKSALRVLACAYKEAEENEGAEKAEHNLIFVGLVGMIDPPRKEAKRAVEKCFNAGMIPVMITGDNIDTAMAIASELGILADGYEAITGLELDQMSDEELYKRVDKIRVYARVSPENKIRIVKAWKKKGKIVAMTGDGVNDAPALKGADIGIGMGITGTEVSKSVSSMVLADDNFATIIVAVKEGRRIYSNIQNVIAYLLASNLAEVLIIAIATFLNKTILLPIQILWINLVTDTIPAIALGFEKEEKGIMKNKPRDSRKSLFTPFLISRIVVPGILKTIMSFGLYFYISSAYGEEYAGATVFITLAIVEILFAYICRSSKKSVFKIGLTSNRPMLLCVVGTLLVQIIILFIPTFSSWLSIPSMPSSIYEIIAITSILIAVVFEIVKMVLAKIFKND
ncbi:MAG: cation-translocating P-type ATPase [Clostridia bacterium]|nr:cation-translocating P-type ATPase [Clostridia bacterium]